MRFIQEDFNVLGRLMNGETIPRPVDDIPVRYGVDTPIQFGGPVALDTETVDGKLWSTQLSSRPGESLFVPATGHDGGLAELTEAVVHNYLYDAQFVDLPPNTHDTMTLAYNLGLPQGLKELAWRLCGMEMASYTETIGGKRKEKALGYLHTVKADSERGVPWTKKTPPPITDLVWDKKANLLLEKVRKPQPIAKKVKRILADIEAGKVNKDGPVDPWDRWHKIDPRERAVVEDVLGDMPDASLADVPSEEAVKYACRDSDATIRVFQELLREIHEKGLELTYELDRRTLPIALEMQRNGMKVDAGYLIELGQDYLGMLRTTAESIFKVVGRRFNPNSPPQLAQLLYGTEAGGLGFKVTKYTPTRMPSTNSEELKKIDHPVIPLLLEYKHIAHIKDSFCDTLPKKVDADGRIHPTIKTTRTETGRWSMAEPNLMQIPNRTEIGRAVRRGFVAEEGMSLVALDFSQIEMRVIAHLARCQSMIRLFQERRDVHTETAAQVFGVPLSVAGESRYRYPCKTLGFGILYGLTGHGLQNQMVENGLHDWDKPKCERFIRDYYRLRPEIKDWQDETKAFARRNGFVTDMFGRMRYTPEMHNPIEKYRSAGERQAINMPVQSGAQGVLKMAMVQMWQRTPSYARWLLQIHDELIWEVPDGSIQPFMLRAKVLMEQAVALTVPVVVEGKSGKNWAEME
jgi:DNA polymerase I-like protein with 3'-5' exonuclease and polymerase domains